MTARVRQALQRAPSDFETLVFLISRSTDPRGFAITQHNADRIVSVMFHRRVSLQELRNMVNALWRSQRPSRPSDGTGDPAVLTREFDPGTNAVAYIKVVRGAEDLHRIAEDLSRSKKRATTWTRHVVRDVVEENRLMVKVNQPQGPVDTVNTTPSGTPKNGHVRSPHFIAQ